MTKEEARSVAFQQTFPDDAEPRGWAEHYFEVGFDAGHAAANQWTYLPELPREFLLDRFLVTLANGKVFEATYNGNSFFPSVDGYFTSANPIIAWRPLPEPAEIKRSEDVV